MIGNLDKYTKPYHFWFKNGFWYCTERRAILAISPVRFTSDPNVVVSIGRTVNEAQFNFTNYGKNYYKGITA